MIRRRTVLGILAGAAGGAMTSLSPAVAAGKPSRTLDPADKDQLALAFRKLAYSADESLTFWWMKGTRYGVQGSVATPFWDMYVAAWFTTRDLPDGRYEVKMAGGNLYTPPGGNTLLEKFLNPYTGETIDVAYSKPRVTTTTFDKVGGSAFSNVQMPGMKTITKSDAIGPGWVDGDTLLIQGDLMMHAEPLDPSRPTFTVNDWSTYVGSVADVLNPKLRNPPASQVFNDILDFPAWLKMGEHKGSYVSRCFGRKVFDYRSMPAIWRNMFEHKYPDIAGDPGAVLRG